MFCLGGPQSRVLTRRDAIRHLPGMQRKGLRNGSIATGKKSADFRGPRRALFAHGTAVAAMDEAVAIAGLAAAFFLKCNPWRDFRTHSNRRNPKGPSPFAFCFVHPGMVRADSDGGYEDMS